MYLEWFDYWNEVELTQVMESSHLVWRSIRAVVFKLRMADFDIWILLELKSCLILWLSQAKGFDRNCIWWRQNLTSVQTKIFVKMEMDFSSLEPWNCSRFSITSMNEFQIKRFLSKIWVRVCYHCMPDIALFSLQSCEQPRKELHENRDAPFMRCDKPVLKKGISLALFVRPGVITEKPEGNEAIVKNWVLSTALQDRIYGSRWRCLPNWWKPRWWNTLLYSLKCSGTEPARTSIEIVSQAYISPSLYFIFPRLHFVQKLLGYDKYIFFIKTFLWALIGRSKYMYSKELFKYISMDLPKAWTGNVLI